MKYLIISIFLLLFFQSKSSAQTLEAQWLHSINSESGSFLNNSSKILSNTTTYVSLGLPVALLAEGYISGNEKTVENGWYVVSSLAVSGVFALSLKYGINRKRPYETYPGYIIPRGTEGSPSFPSVHTSMAFSVATSLSISYPKWYVIAPSMLWATSVGYSRMNLGVHYPSDVAAGAVLGAGSAWLTYKMNQWLHRPIERATKRSMDWLH